MELSRRLQAVADLVSAGNPTSIADVGCDHGYIPIYLVEQKKIERAIAMDVNEGPLEKAREHIKVHGMSTYIETRLSDGLRSLNPGEADTVIVAGMGGGLVIKILEQDKDLWDDIDTFVLQPQSELAKVRSYLGTEGFTVLEEDMILEDGKYYPMMRVTHKICSDMYSYDEADLEYGPLLLRNGHPVLHQFLLREIEMKQSVLASLGDKAGTHIQIRTAELNREIGRAKNALQRYYSKN